VTRRALVAKANNVWHRGGMKFLLPVLALLACLCLPARAQQDAEDRYIGIYTLLQQADNLAATGDPGEALAAYTDAQNQLQQLQKRFPSWSPNIVSFRLNHVTEQIADLQKRIGSVKKIQPPVTPQPAATNAAVPVVNNAAPSAEVEAELENLRTQLQVARTVNELLQAKLKEALSVQPTEADPQALAHAEEKNRWLMKENALLTVARSNAPAAEIITNTVTVVKTLPPTVVTNVVHVTDQKDLLAAQEKLAEAEKNFAAEHARAEKLKEKLQALPPSAPPAESDKLAADLKKAQAQVSSLQSAAEIASLEKLALERKLSDLSAATNAGASVAEYESRLRELTLERNRLIEKVDLMNQKKSGDKDSRQQIGALSDEVSVLRARLAVLEAAPVAFTADEQALFRATVPKPANPDAGKVSTAALPAGTAALVASAQKHFSNQEFDAAEADYKKILERDPKNAIVLANLATIELQEQKFADAEQHITAAVAQSPDDAYNLSTLGYLKFRQEKYDEALDSLSRATQLDPNNAEVQNYLGVTLSHKGQRKAAESALRRSLQLNPNYAPAHNNLAVIYLTQTPPWPEMARWHYQKALDGGQPHNPELEKMLAEKGAPVTP
jgi:tetratricopeptide (TPR) repeat protein